jgi:ketosteroid isomerase-like protein
MKQPSFVLVSCLLVLSCASGRFSTRQEQNKAVVRRLVDAIRLGDLATFNAISDPDAITHMASGASHRGGAPFPDLKSACPLCVAVNPREVRVDFMVAEGDLVTVRSTMRGTQIGQLVGVPPTGKTFEVSYINIYRIRGGHIVENWVGLDRLGLAQQLGMKLCPQDPLK